jgi:hypothetical protein
MAKATAPTRKQNRINVHDLSPQDRDYLTMEVKDTMKKYKVEKQGVYDRRFALNKKLREAGLTVEQALGGNTAPKKAKGKKEEAAVESANDNRELMVVPEKNVPVIMKPIEISFENFSIKLNGVPKKISVNPDTNAIEIDL